MGPLTSIAILLAAAWIAKRVISSRNRAPYPPGPKPWPLIGNTLDLPLTNAPQAYAGWSQQYNSSIIHVEALGNHIIILNSLEDADELLDRRASNYSDRPYIPLLKLLGWEHNVAFFGHTDQWRFHRRIAQQNFRQAAAHKYLPMQTQKVHEMLLGLLEHPEDFDAHNKKLSISIPLSSMYGYEAKDLNDPCVKAADDSNLLGATLLLPGNNFIDAMPILAKVPAWVPGAISVRAAAEVKKLTEKMKSIPMQQLEKKMVEGSLTPSLVTDMLEKKFSVGISKEEEQAVENLAYTVYGAASDTTISVTAAFFHLMVKHPQVQRKAQAEIDKLIGFKRLPEYADRLSGKLPYVEAIYRELLRFSPPLELCVPHAASEDDSYKGYHIPKGATVFPNLWSMTHDETRYPEPFRFMPERFLTASGQLNDDDRILAYGFGFRKCVGKYLASSTMWLIIVSVLACFDIEKLKDKNGNEIEINDEYEEFGLIRHKAKFQCAFKPRSRDIEQLINAANAA